MVCVLEQVNGLYSRITITIVCMETRSLAGVTHTQQHQMEAVHPFNSSPGFFLVVMKFRHRSIQFVTFESHPARGFYSFYLSSVRLFSKCTLARRKANMLHAERDFLNHSTTSKIMPGWKKG